MTRFISSVIIVILSVIASVIVGGYVGYFVGMVYSLTTGWLFATSPLLIAKIFAAAGSTAGFAVIAVIWSIAIAEVRREEKIKSFLDNID